jgi:hypothetical protein
MKLVFLLACCAVAWAQDCDSSIQVSERTSDKQLVLTNGTSKPITAYVLRSVAVDANDSAIRTMSGVFSGKDSLEPQKSMDLGASDAGTARMVIDYVRFADGSSCGPANTPRAQELAAAK